MKITFSSTWKQMGRSVPFWWKLVPSYRTYWGGELIYIGTRCLYVIIDKRGINSFQDFADALTYGKSWPIIRKAKKFFNPK